MAASCTSEQIARMREMVSAGTPRPEVAEQVGVSRRTLWKYTCDLPHPLNRSRISDLKRLRRICIAGKDADRGCGHDLARRFGLAHSSSFWATVHYARKRLAQAETCS